MQQIKDQQFTTLHEWKPWVKNSFSISIEASIIIYLETKMMHIILCWVEQQTKTLHVQSILPLLDNKPAEDINTPFQKLILKSYPK